MPRNSQKKRRDKKRVYETALPKRQYKRTNRLLYVFSGILLVVFGGGAALVGAGTPKGGASQTPPPAVVSPQGTSPVDQGAGITVSPTAAPAAGTPAPAAPTSATPAPATPAAATPAAAPTKTP